jgi:hypothetical protein
VSLDLDIAEGRWWKPYTLSGLYIDGLNQQQIKYFFMDGMKEGWQNTPGKYCLL